MNAAEKPIPFSVACSGITPDIIASRRTAFNSSFSASSLDQRSRISASEMALVLGISDLPEEVQRVWYSAFQAEKPEDYDEFIRQAEALNPYRDNTFSVNGNLDLLRAIGWSFFALDCARQSAAARVIRSQPDPSQFTIYPIDDSSGTYWNESTAWSKFARALFGNQSLDNETYLKYCLNHPDHQPEWLTFQGIKHRKPRIK